MLVKTEATPEQEQQQKTDQESAFKSVMDTLKGSKVQQEIMTDMGLSPKEEPAKEVKEAPKEEVQEEEVEEVEEEEAEEKEDEEVVPKSKVQSRFDKLTKTISELQKEIETLRASKPEADSLTRQLENMSESELKAAKLECRKAQIKAVDDPVKLDELVSLEDKINSIIQDAPKRFEKQQVEEFQRMAKEIAESDDIPDMEKNGPKILQKAKEIYEMYPELHKSVKGQAMALDLAAKHFKEMSSVPGDKSKEKDLKRQVNSLKAKTQLDTKTGKTSVDQAKLDGLRKAAIGGTMQQKLNLVKSHPMFNVDSMIPDEFKGS